jgi:DNA mismatch repair ATPase MutS
MRPLLMFDDSDFQASQEERPGAEDLIQDLELTTVWTTAAAGDTAILASVRTAMLSGLTGPEQIRYRQDVLSDCLRHTAVVREIYRLADQAIVEERNIYRAGLFSRSSEALLNRSVTALQRFVVVLQQLRTITEQHADSFSSPGFVRLFTTLRHQLDDDYFDEIAAHLRTLRFRDGLLASAMLGRQNQGVDYVLRVPRPQNHGNFVLRRPPVKKPVYGRTIPRDDDAGQQDLSALRDRILSLAANVLAQSAEHILTFLTALRTELAFYLGCLNLYDRLAAKQDPLCLPDPYPLGAGVLNATALCDPCLSLRSCERVQGNDLPADGKPLIVITGANEGGKSTYLRSLGLAQIMMQAGIFVAAESFAAAVVQQVFTHYKRGEDPTMASGKFDEELQRMSKIAKRIRPHSLLLSNESFAATNEREGAEIAFEVIRAMNQVGITVGVVTHLYALSQRLYEHRPDTTVFLRADRDSDGRRSHRIIEGGPFPTSYGEDLYRRTFRREPATVEQGSLHGDLADGARQSETIAHPS